MRSVRPFRAALACLFLALSALAGSVQYALDEVVPRMAEPVRARAAQATPSP